MARVPKKPTDGRAAANAAISPRPNGRRYKLVDIVYAVEQSNGIPSQAARMLGCSPSMLYVWAQKHPSVRKAMVNAGLQLTGAAQTIMTNKVANSGKVQRQKCPECDGTGTVGPTPRTQKKCGACSGVGSRVVVHEELSIEQCLSILKSHPVTRREWGSKDTVEHTGRVDHAHVHVTAKMLESATDEELEAIRDGDRVVLSRVLARGDAGADRGGVSRRRVATT